MIYKTRVFLSDLTLEEKMAQCLTSVVVMTPHAETCDAFRRRLEAAGFTVGWTLAEDVRFHTSPDLPK